MKIRNGFVSNSSSSSFVVAFPKDIKSIEEMGEILFRGDWEEQGYVNSYYYDNGKADLGSTVWDVAERIYNDYKRLSKCKESFKDIIIKIFENKMWTYCFDLENYGFDGKMYSEAKSNNVPDDLIDVSLEMNKLKVKYQSKYDKDGNYIKGSGYYDNSKYKKLENKKDKLTNEWATKQYESFIKTHKDFIVLPMEYGDHDGELEGDIEHGGAFDNLVHIKVSNH